MRVRAAEGALVELLRDRNHAYGKTRINNPSKLVALRRFDFRELLKTLLAAANHDLPVRAFPADDGQVV